MPRPLYNRLVIAAGLLALMAGCGSNDESADHPAKPSPAKPTIATADPQADQAAGEATRRHLLYVLRDQLGRAYDELHPAHQQLLTRAQFEGCMAKTYEAVSMPADPVVTVQEVYNDPLDLPLIPERHSKAVTVALGERVPGREDPDVVPLQTQTSHAVYVEGRWRWVLDAETTRAFRRGVCPADDSQLP